MGGITKSRVAPPPVLVVARDAASRRCVAEAIGPAGAVREVAPEALGRRGLLAEAAAAVAVLDRGAAEELTEALRMLRDLPAGRALVLLSEDLSDSALDKAVTRLSASLVLPHPPSAVALRLALLRLVPPGSYGAGARLQHRRANELLGVSAAVRDVMEQVKRVGPTRMAVLILGETGTGKELVARALHEESPRAGRSFVAVNCTALPEALLEAELFGSCKGAYTGADHDRTGLFEQANGGTLFLDEIGDTSHALQAKLLRAIEEQEIRPLGSNQTRRVNVRIVSATHRDLEADVKEGSFRQDLFYRINTATIYLPSLRRRPVDIPFLAQHFAEEFGEVNARRIALDEGFLEALSQHDFPGNVRELRNAVERAIALARADEVVTAEHLALSRASVSKLDLPQHGTLRERVDQLESQVIRDALERFRGNRTRAAALLGLTRQGLRYKMRRHGLS